MSKKVKSFCENNLNDDLRRENYSFDEIEIPEYIRENLQISYLIICSSELVSHLSALNGITFGNNLFDNIVDKRNNFLGDIVKQRLLLGSYFLNKPEILERAQVFRRIVND
jgi:hypothetical protein